MPIEKHYDGHELAELLGLDYETVLRLAQTGEIQSVRVGRLRRFPESAVRTYLDRHRENNIVIDLHSRISPPTTKRRD